MDELVDDALHKISHVFNETWKKYGEFVEREDLRQELRTYYLSNLKKFERWRTEEEGGEFRLLRALFGAAKQYCEREKAEKSGYDFDDIHWYDPALLANLMPMALNSKWDGLSGEDADPGQPRGKTVASEGASLLSMVCDIRRVLKGRKYSVTDFDPDTDTGQARLEWLCEKLGGQFPSAPDYVPGRRKKAA